MTARKTLVRSVEEEDLESGVWAHRSEGQSFSLIERSRSCSWKVAVERTGEFMKTFGRAETCKYEAGKWTYRADECTAVSDRVNHVGVRFRQV